MEEPQLSQNLILSEEVLTRTISGRCWFKVSPVTQV